MNTPLSLDDGVIAALRRIVRAIDLHSRQLVECFSATGPQLIALQDRFRSELTRLEAWEQTQMLATLPRIAAMMDAEGLEAAPVLTTESAVGTPDAREASPPNPVPDEVADGFSKTAGGRDPYKELTTMPQTSTARDHRVTAKDIALPPRSVSMSQDREWCVVKVDGRWKKIRFHDYADIYQIPGLYETLFYDVLGCDSPSKVREILDHCVKHSRLEPGDLKVLDLGAGNGMVGEELAGLGVRRVVGVDIISAAADAARRDREEFYDDYFVLDMTSLSDSDRARLSAFEFNCLTCVAALGFGDTPPAAFANAYNLIRQGGCVAFNIKSEFLERSDPRGFAGLIRRMIDNQVIDLMTSQQYTHRLATSGDPLLYTAFACLKNRDIPADWAL